MDIHVVIFEDNLLLRESLYQLINGTAGLNCIGAFSNCDNIIFNIKKTAPQVVLMDIQMPGNHLQWCFRLFIKEHRPCKIVAGNS